MNWKAIANWMTLLNTISQMEREMQNLECLWNSQSVWLVTMY